MIHIGKRIFSGE